MKKTKERVVAIDYFRGVCMIALVINHAYTFTLPIAYLTGIGRLWTSTSELFFLISGLTYGVVRGQQIEKSFHQVRGKSWRRARNMYVLNILAVFVSLALASIILSFHKVPNITGNLPTSGSLGLLTSTLTLRYIYGSASFLAYYAVLLLAAPFLLRSLYSKRWLAIPILSLALFIATASPLVRTTGALSPYLYFFIWQFYFVIGMTLARFRQRIIMSFYGLRKARTYISAGILISTAAVLTISFYLDFVKPQQYLSSLVLTHHKLHALRPVIDFFYLHHATIDHWLTHERTGLLRPVVSLMLLMSMYIMYQKLKRPLLYWTGGFVNSVGRNSLYVYLAQAMAIPILSALPLNHSSLYSKALLTSMLFFTVWMATQKNIRHRTVNYIDDLRLSYNQAKYGYLKRFEAEET